MPEGISKIKVLVVIGSHPKELIQESLTQALRCEVFSVSTEQAFIETIQNNCPDLILADLQFQGFDTRRALTHVLSLCPDIPIIFITDTLNEEAIDLVAEGAADLVLRGNPQRMHKAIHRAFEKAKKQKEQRRRENSIVYAQSISHTGNWYLDFESDDGYWSDEMFRLYGYEPNSIKPDSEHIMQRIHPDDHETVLSAMKQAVKSNGIYRVEYRIIDENGQVRYALGQGELSYENGTRKHIMGTTQDITQFKILENELLKTKKNLEEAQRIAHLGMWDINLEENELHWSDEVYRIYGMEPQSVKIDFFKLSKYLHPEDQGRVIDTFTKSMANLKPYEMNYRIIRSDGSVRYIFQTGKPIVNEAGELKTVIGTLMDMTESESAKHQLRNTTSLLQKVIDNVPANIVWLDKKMKVKGINRGLLQVFHADSAEKFLGKTAYDLFDRSVAERYAKQNLEIMSTGIPRMKQEVPFGMGGVADQWTQISNVPLYDEEGNAEGLLIVFTDITDQKREELKAKRRAAFDHTILNLARNFINMPIDNIAESIVYALGLMGDYCYADFASVWVYDWRQEEIRRTHAWDKRPRSVQAEQTIPLSDIYSIMERHKKGEYVFYDSDKSAPLENQAEQLTDGCSKFMLFPLLTQQKLYGAFLIGMNSSGKNFSDTETVGIFCEMLLNVLLRKENEIALRESHDRLMAMMNSTNDAVMMFDRAGTVLNLNNRLIEKMGVRREDMLGITLREMETEYEELYQQRIAIIEQVYDTGVPVQLNDQRGGMFFENRYYPVWENGHVSGVTLYSTDRTDREIAESEARRADLYQTKLKALNEFFTNVSHEFKTPLVVILSQLEFMKWSLDDAKMMQELIAGAVQNAFRLTRLVNNVLDISKIDAGFMTPRYEYGDIISLLRSISGSVEVYANTRDIKLTFFSAVKAKRMPMDTEKTERIMLNLLSNAVKFTGKGGSIAVSVKYRRQGGVTVSVADTGCGIPEDEQKHIFDRFAQVDSSTTREHEGCGIGLALVKSIVEILGGTIRVKSEKGKGSEFIFTLPLIEGDLLPKKIEKSGFGLKEKTEIEMSELNN